MAMVHSQAYVHNNLKSIILLFNLANWAQWIPREAARANKQTSAWVTKSPKTLIDALLIKT